MKKLLCMMMLGLFLFAATSTNNTVSLSLVSNAYASDDENKDDANKDDNENKDDNDDQATLSCPEGMTSCYSASGDKFIDVNNLPASAAGATPSKQRSF